MEKITFIKPNGDEISFSDYSTSFNWYSKGDMGSIPTAISTEKGFEQRGTSIIQNLIAARTFVFGFDIRGVNLAAFRENLRIYSRFFNPEEPSYTMQYENSRLGYAPKVMAVAIGIGPGFLRTRGQAGIYSQRSMLNVFAPVPVWSDEGNSAVALLSQEDLFTFPVQITDSFIFGSINEVGVLVDYAGDLKTSIIVQFKGLSTNPIIENVTNGETLKLLTTVADGDSVRIDTAYNNTEVTLVSGEVETDAFQYVDPDNNNLNMTLRPGINLVRYTSDDSARSSAILRYKNIWASIYSGRDS